MLEFKDIVKRCQHRHNKPLKQRQGLATHCLYNMDYNHEFTVYCAQKYPVVLSDLERAHIMFIPIGRAPKHDRLHGNFHEKQSFYRHSGVMSRGLRHWSASWGIQIYTGMLSEYNGARWHDLEFTYQALCAEPEAVIACIEALCNAVDNPLLTISRSGGLRFSCRVQDYLHPNSEEARSYISGSVSTVDGSNYQAVYLEILGENGLSSWDARYEILIGDLLHPPIIEKEVLFAHVDTLRALIHVPFLLNEPRLMSNSESISPTSLSLSTHNLELAKTALLKRGFSYVRKEDGFHKWTKFDTTLSDIHVSLWETNETVWMWAFEPDVKQGLLRDLGLPSQATPITDVWEDTGIPPSLSSRILPISEQVIAVHEGRLSPLAIKRSAPILHQLEERRREYQTNEEKSKLIRDVINRTKQITRLITEMSEDTHAAIESYVIDGGTIFLNVPEIEIAEQAAKRFERVHFTDFDFWKPRTYRWDQVKDIPIDVRMSNPFQAGNVCEDAERCDVLLKKGGDPRVSICPQCPVYSECQERGHLSQYKKIKSVTAQIVHIPKLFFNPLHEDFLNEIVDNNANSERLCVMHESQLQTMFIECLITKELLEEWHQNWQGCTLGNFSRALLNIFEPDTAKRDSIVKRIRTTVNLFQQQQKELVQQMCQINVQGRVIENGIDDPETGETLARFTIQFKGGASAYIPENEKAAKRIKTIGLPFFHLEFFVINDAVRIPMQMTQAIELGVLNISTVEEIQSLPSVSYNHNWTILHQLQRFFAHYKRDADAPIGLSGDTLQFWIPPVLHPKVKHLLVTSSGLSQRYYHHIFQTQETEVVQIRPAAWKTGNQVFQIRTGNYPIHSLLDHDDNWNKSWLSKTGLRFFLGIQDEIEQDPNIKHAIITYSILAKWLTEFGKKENVSCLTNFKEIKGFETEIEEAQVVWVIGTPYWAPGVLWLRSQMMFGNEDKPINYEIDPETFLFKDERVQDVSNQHIISLLSKIIGHATLDRHPGKKLVLLTSVELPDVTDRPETILFDWEDFEVAGGLEKLHEVVETRKRFEKEREEITAEFSRADVERIMGCSTRQANRILQRLRGGTPLRVPLREQILSTLSDGAKSTSELVDTVEGHPVSVQQELRRLVDTNELIRVRRGVYALPESKQE